MGIFFFSLFFLVIIRKWGIFAHYYNITMKRLTTIVAALLVLLAPALGAKKAKKTVETDRQYWCRLAYKMAQPVLENMAKGELQKNMQTEFSPSFDSRDKRVVYMETFGRLMAGIAPWLTLPDDDTEIGRASCRERV